MANTHEATTAELAGIRSDVHEVKHDLASVRASVEECHAENTEFFTSFMSSIEATQQRIDVLRNGPLEEAEMALKEYQASGGDLDELKEASRKARTALITGKTLDIKMSAATIAISASYVYKSKTDSPIAAKQSTVKGTLANIVKHFAPTWADPSCVATEDGRKVMSFLVNLVSCVCALPPENVPVFPELDSRLLPAFSQLCVAQPDLRLMYPGVAGVAAKALLEERTLKRLVQLADEVNVDIDNCASKEQVVETLLASGGSLEPGPATGDRTVFENHSMLDLCVLAQEKDVDISLCKDQAIRILLGSGKGLQPRRDAETDRAALMTFFVATYGPSWAISTGWGTSAAVSEWHGVTVDGSGRVTELRLGYNKLTGSIPAALGRLTALEQLHLQNNHLSGSVPAELGGLTALKALILFKNQLCGPIPAEFAGLTAVKTLFLHKNRLSGPIPVSLGGLTSLDFLGLHQNQLNGSIPTVQGGLSSLKGLCLEGNQLTRSEGDVKRILPECNENAAPFFDEFERHIANV